MMLSRLSESQIVVIMKMSQDLRILQWLSQAKPILFKVLFFF